MNQSDELDLLSYSLSYSLRELIAEKFDIWIHPCTTKAKVIMAITEELMEEDT